MAIRRGDSIEAATAAVGIDDSTYYKWMQRASTQDAPSEFIEFFKAIKKAQAEAESKYLAVIRKAAVGHKTRSVKKTAKSDGSTETVETVGQEFSWQAAAWWLERKYPERWANTQRIKVQVEKELEATLDRLEKQLPPEVYQQVLVAISTEFDGQSGPEEIAGD